MVEGVVRQNDGGIPGDMPGKKRWIIVIVMKMRHIEVRRIANSVRIDVLITGKRKPGGKVGRIKPGITQDTFTLCLYKEARLAQKGDLHPSVLLRGDVTLGTKHGHFCMQCTIPNCDVQGLMEPLPPSIRISLCK